MDGREAMAPFGSASYYLQRDVTGSGSGAGSITQTGVQFPSGFRTVSNPNVSVQSSVKGNSVGSTFQVDNSSPNFSHGISMVVASGVPPSDLGKKKRGRPRKYGPDGASMSLGLSPMSSRPSPGSLTPSQKRARGRPPGSGWKQKLAPLGEWMNSSAGLAFTPHVINIAVGEDVAAKILSFAQQRPRAICILSANGAVSAVTLRQPTSSSTMVTYEGRFQILCLSGSYLLAESGGPRSRTGGLSISVCSPDGHVIGGGIGGRLIAASLVQVVVCSFVYGGSKTKNKTEAGPKGDDGSEVHLDEISSTPARATLSQNLTPNSETGIWPLGLQPDLKNPHTEIDLTRG